MNRQLSHLKQSISIELNMIFSTNSIYVLFSHFSPLISDSCDSCSSEHNRRLVSLILSNTTSARALSTTCLWCGCVLKAMYSFMVVRAKVQKSVGLYSQSCKPIWLSSYLLDKYLHKIALSPGFVARYCCCAMWWWWQGNAMWKMAGGTWSPHIHAYTE